MTDLQIRVLEAVVAAPHDILMPGAVARDLNVSTGTVEAAVDSLDRSYRAFSHVARGGTDQGSSSMVLNFGGLTDAGRALAEQHDLL
ncbi:hypothetical protein [Nocardiopsis sp. YSL2]|uniref:hypothetical protein n=1 Tax=Nocardiopsis sp. YSL2 TaxID=2939492 RepID=UPI0026F44543|nr:hypothetical protein [Nocardiopsis sp. YSL2]